MPELPPHKAGIVACSGEELAEGTVARLAALRVLQQLRPNDTVTICLPLFLAGGAGDRAFARFHPTITVDGCDLRCAARATELHSGRPAASIVVNELVAEAGLPKPDGRRCLNAAGRQAVDLTADRLAQLVDQVLRNRRGNTAQSAPTAEPAAPQQEVEATCSCGSGIPVRKLPIDGRVVEIVALPLIFKQMRENGREPNEAVADELLQTVKIYNAVPPDAEASYREAILRDYIAFCQQERSQ